MFIRIWNNENGMDMSALAKEGQKNICWFHQLNLMLDKLFAFAYNCQNQKIRKEGRKSWNCLLHPDVLSSLRYLKQPGGG